MSKDIIIDKLSITDLTDEQLTKLTFDTLQRYVDVDERVKTRFANGFTKVEDLGMVCEPSYLIRYFQAKDPNILQKIEKIALEADKSTLLDPWVDYCGDPVVLHYVDVSLKEGEYQKILNHEHRIKKAISFEDPKWVEALRLIDKHGPRPKRKDILRLIITSIPTAMLEQACEIVSKQNSSVPSTYMLIWRDDIPNTYHEKFARAYANGAKSDGAISTQINPDIVAKLPAVSRLNFLERAINGPYPFTTYVDQEQASQWIFATTFKYTDITTKIIKKFDRNSYVEQKQKTDRYGYSYGYYRSAYEQTWWDCTGKAKYVPSVEINQEQE